MPEVFEIKRIEKLRKHLRKFERSIEQQIKKSTCCSGVTLKQCHTLLTLSELSSCTLNDLANELQINKSSASRNIENLFKMKLVNRVTNPDNRRETLLTLTKKGVDIVNSINKENNDFYLKILNTIQDEKVDTIIESLELLSNAMFIKD